MTFRGCLDWFGRTSPFQPEFGLEIKEGVFEFAFRAAKKAHCNDSLGLGQHVAELWKMDVAEVFLSGPGGAYQEINVSPRGAWWSALFSDYRLMDRELEFAVEIAQEVKADSWQIHFRTSLENIVPWRGLSPEEFMVSATAILYAPEPHYFALHHQNGGEPDFHRRDLLKPLQW